jgi:hypothetical protein
LPREGLAHKPFITRRCLARVKNLHMHCAGLCGCTSSHIRFSDDSNSRNNFGCTSEYARNYPDRITQESGSTLIYVVFPDLLSIFESSVLALFFTRRDSLIVAWDNHPLLLCQCLCSVFRQENRKVLGIWTPSSNPEVFSVSGGAKAYFFHDIALQSIQEHINDLLLNVNEISSTFFV